MSVRGQAALLTWIPETVWPERDCEVVTVGGRPERVWWMRLDNRVAVRASCHDDDDGHQWIEEVFSLSGESVRLEASKPRTADHQAADGTDQPQEASALEEEIRIDRSRSRELAIVPDFETKSLWLYDSTEERLLPISDALGGIRVVAWQDDHVVWDTYWHGQERVAIVPRWDYYGGRGALLVDLSSRIGVPFDYGDISSWPCLATESVGTLRGIYSRSASTRRCSARSRQHHIGLTASQPAEISSISASSLMPMAIWQGHFERSEMCLIPPQPTGPLGLRKAVGSRLAATWNAADAVSASKLAILGRRELLIVVARHAAEHYGQAQLTRDLVNARRSG